MHLTVVAEQLRAPVPGGTGRYTGELLRALKAVARPDDRVAPWYAPGTGRLGRLRQPVLAELWRYGRGPAPHDTDVVFAPTPLTPAPHRRPLIVTIHDAVPWTHPETLTARGARWHRAMGEQIAAGADVVLTPTAAVATELSRWLPLRRVEVVGEGVSAAVAVIPADAPERARRLSLPAAYALAVGTVEPRKGLDLAVAALAAPNWPGLPLLIAGPAGWGAVRLPGAERISGRVRLLGRLSDDDLATVYSRASVLVMPSRAEGFGLPLLEAMTHGVPVVISDAPALVEVAGGAAIVVPRGTSADSAPVLAAAVGRALAERTDLAAASRARSKDFSWELSASRVWEICRELLSPDFSGVPR